MVHISPFVEGRISGLVLLLIMIVTTLYYMNTKKLPYVRRVPAIDAINEAIGRSTELGRPVLFSPGMCLYGIDYWTVAALSMLTHVARQCVRNDIRLLVPLGGSDASYTTMEVSRDIVETQYRLGGKNFIEKHITSYDSQYRRFSPYPYTHHQVVS